MRWLWWAAPALLGGCVGLHSNQPTQQQFVLSLSPAPPPAGAASEAKDVPSSMDTLVVQVPAAAPGLAGDYIAVLRPQGQLDYYSGAHWAIDAPLMLQRLVIDALRRRGRFALVESESGAFDARYILSMELTQFQADYSDSGPPTVHVSLFCTLGRRADRSAITTLTVSGTQSASADRMREVVAAFQRATDEVLARMAEELEPPAPAGTAAPAREVR